MPEYFELSVPQINARPGSIAQFLLLKIEGQIGNLDQILRTNIHLSPLA
jgi:hypothetical protein